MKVSIEWLKEYSDIDVSTKELFEMLTMTGSKVEAIETKGDNIKGVVVGKILEIEKHPDADKLVVTKVSIGNEELQIVTGATNIEVGNIVPIAKVGAELPEGIKIKKGQLRGVDSYGMMCSIGELELSINDYPEQIEDGIMILPAIYEKYLGNDIVEVLNLREDIIEFEITPNRPDCLSVEGLGRETAITLKKNFKNPRKDLQQMIVENKQELEGLKVEIQAPELCYRYVARVIKDVKIEPSPEWMKRRLKAAGIRTINNIVDITNYVMLELGQPMHAFDINSIQGKQIIVRRAKPAEKAVTLDEEERILTEDMLVIADKEKTVGIAGVMGGRNSEIESTTNTVVLESAVFNGGNIRITAKKLGLRTEASARYEKGLSQENAVRVINRAVQLIEQLGAGKAVEGKIDIYPTKQLERKINFEPQRINELLGTDIAKEEMIDILEKLDMKIEKNQIIPPFYRQDIEGNADIAEEVLRIYGYDKLQSSLMVSNTTLGEKTKIQKNEAQLLHYFYHNGFSEIYTYSFYNDKELEKIGMLKDSELVKEQITLKNPLNDDYTTMRTTTLPSMLQTLAFNYAQKNQDVKLFEIARTYCNRNQSIEKEELPEEEQILTIGLYGKEVDFYLLKGYVENILELVNVKHYEIQKETNHPTYHPGRAANIWVGKDKIATLGEIHPAVMEKYNIKEKVYIAEVSIEKITKYGKDNKKYVPIPKYPAVERDLAMVVEENIENGTVEKLIQKKAKNILEEVKLFDIYHNEKLGKNKKSLAYSLKFRSAEKTLTDEQINETMKDIIEILQKELKAELRQ